MYALSLWQPIAHFVVDGTKPLENRTWAPPRSVIGHRIALHAADRYDADLAHWVERAFPELRVPRPEEVVRGAVVGVATVRGVLDQRPGALFSDVDWAIKQGIVTAEELRWNLHQASLWVLREPAKLAQPVPCSGHQRLWHLPPDVLKQVEAQL